MHIAPRSRIFTLLSILAAFALGITLATVWQANAQDQTTTSDPAIMGSAALVEQLRPAVVTVVNLQEVTGFGPGGDTQQAGSGTGFIIDNDGNIVTNQHVVAGGDEFQVILADGTAEPATLVGADPFTDLAVVRMEGEVPATVPLGDSDALMPGQPVLAIGSPLGAFTNTVTDGIVSALNRDFPDTGGQGTAIYSNLIQHNADINPGNSGGPLFNLAGEVIGVNTLGLSVVPGQGTPAQGLFFAIPSNLVQGIVNQLIENGQVTYPYIGISFQTVTPDLAAQYDLPVQSGVYVISVEPGSPADEAGIQAGDFITSLGGQAIDAENSFQELLLFSHAPGETIDVGIVRDEKEQTVQVTLGDRGNTGS
jgi:2-alkenal reductase